MKPTVYIETSVVSYLTGRPARDVVVAAHQELTRQWWETRFGEFELLISELVREEAAQGDQKAAAKRLSFIEKLSVLEINDPAIVLAEELVQNGPIPQKYGADALHIAISSTNGIDYLLTWNCKHLANAALRHKVEMCVEEAGYTCPVICTPEELMEE